MRSDIVMVLSARVVRVLRGCRDRAESAGNKRVFKHDDRPCFVFRRADALTRYEKLPIF